MAEELLGCLFQWRAETSGLLIRLVQCRLLHFHSNLPCTRSEGRDPENTLLDSTDLREYTSAGLFPRWMTKPFLSLGSFLLTGVTVNCYSSTFCGCFVPMHWAPGFILHKHLLLFIKQTSLHYLSGPDTSPSSSPHQKRQGQSQCPYQSLCCLLCTFQCWLFS